jgi:hypothetical protein
VTDSTYDWLTWGLMDCPKGRLSPELHARMEVDRRRAASLPLAGARLPFHFGRLGAGSAPSPSMTRRFTLRRLAALGADLGLVSGTSAFTLTTCSSLARGAEAVRWDSAAAAVLRWRCCETTAPFVPRSPARSRGATGKLWICLGAWTRARCRTSSLGCLSRAD